MSSFSRRHFVLSLSATCVIRGVLARVSDAASLTPVAIEVPSRDNLQFLALWVAVGSGAFERQGLTPQILVAPSTRQSGDMLPHGTANVALLPPPMFLGMMAEDKPIRLFASLLANEPINLVLNRQIAERQKFTPSAPLRQKLDQLHGLRVGLAPEVAPRLRAIYSAAGLNASGELSLVTIPGPQQVKAFAAGQVDMLFAHTPYLETALIRYGAVLAVNASDGEVSGLADGQIHALATTPAMIAERRDLLQRVTTAVSDAERQIHAAGQTALDALMKFGADRLDPRLAAATMAVYSPAVPESPAISIAGILRDRAIYPAHPRAPDFSVVRVEDFVDNSFANAVRTAK